MLKMSLMRIKSWVTPRQNILLRTGNIFTQFYKSPSTRADQLNSDFQILLSFCTAFNRPNLFLSNTTQFPCPRTMSWPPPIMHQLLLSRGIFNSYNELSKHRKSLTASSPQFIFFTQLHRTTRRFTSMLLDLSYPTSSNT